MRANAQRVVDEIRAVGGEAVADQHSVAEEEDARNVVATALDTTIPEPGELPPGRTGAGQLGAVLKPYQPS